MLGWRYSSVVECSSVPQYTKCLCTTDTKEKDRKDVSQNQIMLVIHLLLPMLRNMSIHSIYFWPSSKHCLVTIFISSTKSDALDTNLNFRNQFNVS